MKHDSSVNFYMFHGGTNFGFMNGANEGIGATNEGGGEPYSADVTSYGKVHTHLEMTHLVDWLGFNTHISLLKAIRCQQW